VWFVTGILTGGRILKTTFVVVSLGRYFVSELRPLTGLLFIPEVTYEYGEPECNIDGGK
jgi:hypothetical protein